MLRLTIERQKRGISQSKLARMADMNGSSVNAIEKGRIEAWPGWQERIAAALEWEGEPSELFKEVEVHDANS